jgi:hypothetical protein
LAEGINRNTGETVTYDVKWDQAYLYLVNITDGTEFGKFFAPPDEGLRLLRYQYQYETLNIDSSLSLQERQNFIYSAETHHPIQLLSTANGGEAMSAKFSPDGSMLATINTDRLTLWGIPNSPLCPELPNTQLEIGQQAITTAPTGPRDLRIRTYPNGIVTGSIPSGTMIEIVRGPICDAGLVWWGIQTLDGMQHGWSAEAINADDPFFIPA